MEKQSRTIAERQKVVKGYRYVVTTEDGRVVEDLYVDDNSVTSFIDSRLSKSFKKTFRKWKLIKQSSKD